MKSDKVLTDTEILTIKRALELALHTQSHRHIIEIIARGATFDTDALVGPCVRFSLPKYDVYMLEPGNLSCCGISREMVHAYIKPEVWNET